MFTAYITYNVADTGSPVLPGKYKKKVIILIKWSLISYNPIFNYVSFILFPKQIGT